jgi:GT2 family glycosyltransferase
LQCTDYVFSIIILNWNGKYLLQKCVESVMNSDYPKQKMEVIIVDNGSIDDSVEFVKSTYGSKVKLITSYKNVGFCRGNNIGIREATGDIIILLNNDTIVRRDWLRQLASEFLDHRIGIVGCLLLYPETNIIQSSGFVGKTIGIWENIDSEKNYDGAVPSDVDFVPGAAIAVRKTVIEQIGLLNNRYEAAEDIEWCYRARQAGYRVIMSRAQVYHYGGLSWNKFSSIRRYIRENISRHHIILDYFPVKCLPSYFMTTTIKELGISANKFARGDTSIQKVRSFYSNNRKSILISAIKQVVFEFIGFSWATFFVVIERTTGHGEAV